MNKNNITISSEDVVDFKGVYCDENPIIRDILKNDFSSFFEGTILDVGGGTGDILSEVIPEKNVIHLDVLDFSDKEIPEKHTRLTGDFFNREIIDKIGSIDVMFMSHVQQFIDGDLEKLKSAVEYVNTKKIILVEDMNDDFLGEVMRFSLLHFENANPEVKIEGFPYGYRLAKSKPFVATLSAATFLELTKQCLYLMDLKHTDENIGRMLAFLESKLSEPKFTTNREINIYEK